MDPTAKRTRTQGIRKRNTRHRHLLVFYAVLGVVLTVGVILAVVGQLAAAGIVGGVWMSACGVLRKWRP